jgi:hypothetical protein
MVEVGIGESENGTSGIGGEVGGLEAKRNKLRFKRANAADTTTAFTNGSETASIGQPRKSKRIGDEKRIALEVEDSNVRRKVKGKAPLPPEDDNEAESKRKGVKRKVGNRYKTFPTSADAKAQADFILTGIEVAAVTTVGPTGEMSEWERAIMSGPLQRMLERTPLSVVERGGVIFDVGFLVIGGSIYFSRIMQGIQLPTFGKMKPKGVQEDKAAPVAAPAYQTVATTKAGDVDGLAQPIPSVITQTMNGVI